MQVAGHPAVVALPQAVGFAAATVIQQHAPPAPRLARPQQPPHIGRPQVALESRQHDHDRAAPADPVEPHEIPVGKLQSLGSHIEPDPPRQNRPERLAVSPRQPPTRLESTINHPPILVPIRRAIALLMDTGLPPRRPAFIIVSSIGGG